MKRDKRYIFLAVFFLLLVLGGFGWLLLQEKPAVKHIEIPVALIENVEPSRYSIQPVDVIRKSTKEQVMVLFPVVKRETRLSLYNEQSYNLLLAGESSVKSIYLSDAERLRIVHGRPVINFSELSDGNYYAHLSSCNYGGFFCFQLQTIK